MTFVYPEELRAVDDNGRLILGTDGTSMTGPLTMVVKRGDLLTSWPVEVGPAEPPAVVELEPPVPVRLRSLADAEIEAAKDGSRTQKAAAKASARAYRIAADMIEEDDR